MYYESSQHRCPQHSFGKGYDGHYELFRIPWNAPKEIEGDFEERYNEVIKLKGKVYMKYKEGNYIIWQNEGKYFNDFIQWHYIAKDLKKFPFSHVNNRLGCWESEITFNK